MKTLFLSSILLLTTSYANELKSELNWVDQQVQAIKPPREGINNSKLSVLSTPFIFLEKNKIKDKEANKNTKKTDFIPKKSSIVSTSTEIKKIEEKKLQVDAIINKSILINGKWYKTNDKVNGYTIKNIGYNSATLIRNEKELVLTTSFKNSNIKFINK